jgi:hypothetical protein
MPIELESNKQNKTLTLTKEQARYLAWGDELENYKANIFLR